MTTRREAENVIRKIRKSRRADDAGGTAGDANARSLSRALDMLSTQLYTKATHFILELIQNADDNTYAPGIDPLLKLVYRDDGYLWIGCNEVGFSEANVNAICDINDSTKKVKDAAKGYIGEKGIGFKSVFRVADVVWISSGNYTFRFERDSVLGMIVPIWCPFNSTSLINERTMFCLRIPNINDRNTVKADLLSLQTELLLFLRKLKTVDVRIYNVSSSQPSTALIHTRKPELHPHGIITLACNNLVGATVNSEELFMSRNIIEGMPHEAKREGIRATEIVLAFPLTSSSHALQARPVYNFLPIRSFGFTFLLQADFILTASREDIARGNEWNNALLEGALDLFISAVREMNRTGLCKYSWPRFVARNTATRGTIMDDFTGRLQNRLKDESVLESQAGYISRPAELMLVPEHFTDGAEPRRPLFDDILNTFKYASFEYSQKDLESLGMSYQTPQQISALLKWMSPQQLSEKSAAWHSRLAVGIAQAGSSTFETSKLIPLRTGEWICSLDEPFYFPSLDDQVEIPDGISVRIISKSACADPSRKHLFGLLGAKPLTASQVCNLILDQHRFLSPSNNKLSTECLVSHAVYLFYNGTPKLNYASFKLANELGQAVSGEELYMQLPSSRFCMKDFLPNTLFAADFVHPNYLTAGNLSSRQSWHKWLTDTVHVSLLPNLVSNRKGALTREFQYIVDNHPSRVWLSLIRDNWTYYAQDPAITSKRIASLPVQCTNQTRCQLQETYLPTAMALRVPLADRHIPFIDVPDPEHHDWLNFERLGLRTAPDLDFYLKILCSVARCPPSETQKRDILLLYEGIQNFSRGDVDHVKKTFVEQRLIFPQKCEPTCSWLSLSESRWKGPAFLGHIEALSDEFSSCRELFVETLHVQDANAADILNEILTYSDAHAEISSATIRTLLLTLSTFALDATELDPQLERLAQLKVVPVRRAKTTRLCAFTDTDWFVADRLRYAKSFEGKLWFLDFDKMEIGPIAKLLERMGLRERQLSKNVTEETISEGRSKLHQSATREFQAKAPFIAMLGHTSQDRNRILSPMQNIEVCFSKSLVLRRRVTVHDEKIFGDDEQGIAVLQTENTTPQIHFSVESMANQVLPWHFVCDSLLSYLEIPEEKHALLNSILHTRDLALVEDVLERAGLLEDQSVLLNPRNGYVKENSGSLGLTHRRMTSW